MWPAGGKLSNTYKNRTKQRKNKASWIKMEQHKAKQKATWSEAKQRAQKISKTTQLKRKSAERSNGNTPDLSEAKRNKVELTNSKNQT